MEGVQELPIPIIDLAADKHTTATALRDACTKHGFFFVSNHGVTEAVSKELFKQSKAFFALPEERKLQSEAVGNRGYTRLGEQTLDPSKQTKGDTKESYYICRPAAPEGSEKAKLPFHAPNRWPDASAAPGFKPAMEQYMDCMEATVIKLVELVSIALNLPEAFFLPHFEDAILTLRPIHYTAEQSNEGGGVFSAGAHTDWGFCTFVDTDDTPGLQVYYQEKWVAVPCVKHAFVVNIGDLLQRWTNGMFKSTLHRVVNATPGRERYSCAYFVSPRYDAKIECLPTCTGSGAQYEPITCAEHLNMKYKSTHANFRTAASF